MNRREMLLIDPQYGSQQHQRDFTARMERRAARLQELLPCPTAHEHAEACYPAELVKRVAGEVQS